MKDENSALTVSERGLQLIIRWEGFSEKVYKDNAGYKTIGFGHKLKPDEYYAELIDKTQAGMLLRSDALDAEKTIHSSVNVSLSQTQYDALVSFVYNVGAKAFIHSTLLTLLNSKKYIQAGEELLRWNKVRQNGILVECPGLTARRAFEHVMFNERCH